jgi:hypothetical protein
MLTNRLQHTATLLADGRVLIAGGITGSGGRISLDSTEIFDPASGNWIGSGSLNKARCQAASIRLPNGKVLLTGGRIATTTLSDAALFDPASGLWTIATPMNSPRYNHTMSLLPNGLILVTGGASSSSPSGVASTELYDPTDQTWTTNVSMSLPRTAHWAALMPSGRLMVGGGNSPFNSTEMYDQNEGAWSPTGLMISARGLHIATLLANGKVLVTGGFHQTAGPLTSCELYNPTNGTWSSAASMASPRYYHTATLLPDGKVLVVGGRDTTNTVTGMVELYDPTSDIWTNTASLNVPRGYHTATLMLNGKVLVAGGVNNSNLLSSTEVYDPRTETWSFGGNLNTARDFHPAQLIPAGKVLIGFNDFAPPEIYDPATEIWAARFSPGVQRYPSSALLSDGGVLESGGYNYFFNVSSNAYTFDPSNGAWNQDQDMKVPRIFHKVITSPNGKCFVTGGVGLGGVTNSAEFFDPSTGSASRWKLTGSMATARRSHTMTLLRDGTVLVAGGYGIDTNNPTLQSAEIYNPGPITNLDRPTINNPISAIDLGTKITVSGSGFLGVSESTGGNGFQSCAANFPLLQIINLETTQTIFLPCTNWTDTSLTTIPLTGFPPGPALLTVYVNGIASLGSITSVNVPSPVPPLLVGIQMATTNSFKFSFTNISGSQFSVLATTNVSLPLSSWTAIGGPIESPIGQFQFTNSVSTNFPYHFFGVRSQ